jgi:pimeloyl-ACP methyl ester carboxylesterase
VEFADTVAALCDELGTGPLRAVIGHSAGGPTAVALVERHPDLTRRLVLISARSPLPFPTGATRALARIAFAPGRERWVWAGFRRLLTVSPGFGLRVMLGTLSTAPLRSVLADLGPGEREELVQVFAAMRSGSGFAVDVHHAIDPALGTGVRRPALIVASRSDGQVVWEHAEQWHRLIAGSSLWESPALGHLVWFGAGAARTEQHVVNFLSGGR